jgi:hypothetical protein
MKSCDKRRGVRVLAAAALAAGLAGAWAQTLDAPRTVKGFRLPQRDEQNRLKSQFLGESAEVQSNGNIRVVGARLELYKEGRLDAVAESSECLYDKAKETISSASAIRIENDGAVITGVGWKWERSEETATILTEAKVVLKNAKGWFVQEVKKDAR